MSHLSPRPFVAAALLLSTLAPLPAQDAAAPMVSMRATGVPQILAAWPQSRLGKLLADPEVAPAAQAVMQWLRNQHTRRKQVLAAAGANADIEAEPYLLSMVFREPDISLVLEHPFAEQRSYELLAMTSEEAASVIFLSRLCCRPQFEGRWSMEFEQELQALRQNTWFDVDFEAKIGGNPAVTMAPRGSDGADIGPFLTPAGLWRQRLPGTFMYGNGSHDQANQLQLPPIDETPQVALTIDLQQYLAMFLRLGVGMPAEFKVLGFDSLAQLEWRARLVGELLLDEIELLLTDETTGLIGILLNHAAPLPPQALPKGAMVQLRTAVDFKSLIAILRELGGDQFEMTEQDEKDLLAGLTGGVALGVTAPAPGGLIPRLYLSLGIADGEAMQRAVASAIKPLEETGVIKQIDYDGVACSILQFPDLPQGIQPAFCIHDGALHIAESGRSLRALLKAQASGDEAMDVGDAPLPAGAGNLVPHFDLRFAPAVIYKSYHQTWLPLFAMANAVAQQPALERADLPAVDVIEDYCSPGRGILRRGDRRYTLQMLSPLGGPELAALAMTFGPMLSGFMTDYPVATLTHRLAEQKLNGIAESLQAFHTRNGRWPTDLPELYAAARLPADALLIPGDDLAETVTLANGNEIRTSFRYFSPPFANSHLLVEIRPQKHGRRALGTDGALQELYGNDAWLPIERLAARK